VKLHYERPHPGTIAILGAYVLATAGLMILAFDDALFDEWAIVGAGVVTLATLVVFYLTRHPVCWLVVAAAWVYAAVIELFRGPNGYEKSGLALVFFAFALGALATYTGYRREAVGEEVSL
jgi:hypothetical protein